MVPGPPFLSLTMAWAADYDPSKRPVSDSPHSADGNDGDSDSELFKSPFDLCLARSVTYVGSNTCYQCYPARDELSV